MSLLKLISPTTSRLLLQRAIHTSTPQLSVDLSEKRKGMKVKTDNLEGEAGLIEASSSSYELVDENVLDKIINNVKFKDIHIIHINCTRNNTKVTLCKGDGSYMFNRTAGSEGYKHCRKGTTVAAQAVANRIVTMAGEIDVKMARLVFNGLGPGRGAAYKVFENSDIKIVSLTDITEAIEPWLRRPRHKKRV